ncbi:MAG TPA: radical SAM protein [Dehalococcoidia bacterium]|nr:radical SAM protein [Dehalococcoidia bacterium]
MPDVRALARERIAHERGATVKDWGGRIAVAIVYPNSYYIGMSNLALQTVYSLFNAYPDFVCERAFYDPPSRDARHPYPVVSMESQRSLADFAVLAFTLSYEFDYFNMVQTLRSAGIPLYSEQRDERHPLVIAGGACMLTNPAGVAPFLDVAVVGEGEEVIPALVAAWRDGLYGSRDELLDELAEIPGLYVPSRPPIAGAVERQWVHDISSTEAYSTILTADTELSDMTLIEVARGCGRGCRFCIAGYVFRPPRYRSKEQLLSIVEHSLAHTPRVGLLGAAVADHPELSELVVGAHELGARVSVSSMRVDNLDPRVLRALAAGGTKTVTVAPEAGSERMRLAINKGVTEEQILEGAARVGEAGAARFKLYFMIGLPGEEDDDVYAMAALGNKIKDRLDRTGSGTRLVLSVSPTIPKPWTAYQYEVQAAPDVIKRRQGILKQHLAPGIDLRSDSPMTARVDDVLSRADARLAPMLESMTDNSLGAYRRAIAEHGLDGPLPWEGERPPWFIVDVGMTERFLLREMDKHERVRRTIPCPPPEVGCKLCGVC